MRPAAYRVYDGWLQFTWPDGCIHEEPAARIDHPETLCRVLELVACLTGSERWSLVNMVTHYELDKVTKKSSA